MIKGESGQLNRNLTLIFKIRCKHYKKKKSSAEISVLSLHFEPTWSSHISHWAQTWHFYPGDLANFAGITIIFFFNAALIIPWFDQIAALLRWTSLLLLWGTSSLTTSPGRIFFLLLLLFLHPTVLAVFFCNKFVSISFIETFEFFWEIVLGEFLEISFAVQ